MLKILPRVQKQWIRILIKICEIALAMYSIDLINNIFELAIHWSLAFIKTKNIDIIR